MDSFIFDLDNQFVVGQIFGIINLVIILIKIFIYIFLFYTLIKVNKYINRKNKEEGYGKLKENKET